jgi:hypothetical protein
LARTEKNFKYQDFAAYYDTSVVGFAWITQTNNIKTGLTT